MTSFNKIERIKIPCGAGGKGRKWRKPGDNAVADISVEGFLMSY